MTSTNCFLKKEPRDMTSPREAGALRIRAGDHGGNGAGRGTRDAGRGTRDAGRGTRDAQCHPDKAMRDVLSVVTAQCIPRPREGMERRLRRFRGFRRYYRRATTAYWKAVVAPLSVVSGRVSVVRGPRADAPPGSLVRRYEQIPRPASLAPRPASLAPR